VTRDRRGALPNLVVIGAKKCGTTSLHAYLDLHPEIAMSREKELDFFIADRNWRRGVDWYRAQFRADAAVRGEASTMYANYPTLPGVPERMHAVVPDARLVYVVRDPIERIVSSWVHNVADGFEQRPLAEALADPESSPYVYRSRYGLQLAQYLEHFARDRILILTLDDLRDRRDETLRSVFRFLGVDEGFRSPGFATVHNRTADKRRKSGPGDLLRRLGRSAAARLVPSNARLRLGLIVYRPMSRAIERPQLSDELLARVAAVLRPDLRRFRELGGVAPVEWCV
jgi:hypothetical protein